LNEKNQQPRMLLLAAGGELRLSGPSLEIVQLCDGKHTVQQIAEKTCTRFMQKRSPSALLTICCANLVLLHEQRAIDFDCS